MSKKLILKKIENRVYRIDYCNDEAMQTLYFFLSDGLGTDSYVNFLKDKNRSSFGGNVSYLEKKDKNVVISLDETVFDDMDPISLSQEDLLSVLHDWHKYKLAGWSQIEFVLDEDNKLTVQAS